MRTPRSFAYQRAAFQRAAILLFALTLPCAAVAATHEPLAGFELIGHLEGGYSGGMSGGDDGIHDFYEANGIGALAGLEFALNGDRLFASLTGDYRYASILGGHVDLENYQPASVSLSSPRRAQHIVSAGGEVGMSAVIQNTLGRYLGGNRYEVVARRRVPLHMGLGGGYSVAFWSPDEGMLFTEAYGPYGQFHAYVPFGPRLGLSFTFRLGVLQSDYLYWVQDDVFIGVGYCFF